MSQTNNEIRQHVRISILSQCQNGGERGLTLSAIQIGVRASGIKTDNDKIGEEITYLVDKKFLAVVEPAVSPEIWRARTTADGRDFLAKEGF